MPADMSKEFSQIGDVSVPPGQPEQLHAAKSFPQPEYRKDPPDIRAQIDPEDPFGQPDADEWRRQGERLLHEREDFYLREAHPFHEQLTRGTAPSEILDAARRMMSLQEGPLYPQEFQGGYRYGDSVNAAILRAQALRVPVSRLLTSIDLLTGNRKLIEYDPETGIGRPADAIMAGYAIGKVEGKWYFDNKDGLREKLAIASERAALEMSIRLILGKVLGVVESFRDDYAGLTTMLFQRTKGWSMQHLKEIFKLPAVDKVDNDPHDKTFGKQIEKAMWWYFAMLRSQTKEGMEDFLSRPATKELITAGMGEDEAKRFLETYIGKVNMWVDDSSRLLNRSGDEDDSLTTENNGGLRGPIAKYGSIPARGELPFGQEEEFIKLIGELSGGGLDASWMALGLLKAWGVFADEGTVILLDKNGKIRDVSQKLGDDIAISSDDRGKANVSAYAFKEAQKGRLFGAAGFIDELLPELGHDFMKLAAVLKNVTGEDGPVRRSLLEAWLGYQAGPVTVKIAQKGGGVKTETRDGVFEEYVPLADLNWDSLKRGVWAGATQLWWLAARQEKGVFEFLTENNLDPRLFSDKGLRTVRKFMTIVFNAGVLSAGLLRGYRGRELVTFAESEAKRVMEKWYIAALDLPDVRTNVMARNIKVVGQDGTVIEKQGMKVIRKIARHLGFTPKKDYKPGQDSELVAELGKKIDI